MQPLVAEKYQSDSRRRKRKHSHSEAWRSVDNLGSILPPFVSSVHQEQTHLSGERIGRLLYERMNSDVLQDTPEMIHNMSQPDFEGFVAAALAEDPNNKVRKGMAYVSSQQHRDIVHTFSKNAKPSVNTGCARNTWLVAIVRRVL